jgi:hypothetical protein
MNGKLRFRSRCSRMTRLDEGSEAWSDGNSARKKREEQDLLADRYLVPVASKYKRYEGPHTQAKVYLRRGCFSVWVGAWRGGEEAHPSEVASHSDLRLPTFASSPTLFGRKAYPHPARPRFARDLGDVVDIVETAPRDLYFEW